MTGPGFGGRVGASNLIKKRYSSQQGGMIKETWMEEDPREAILKFADFTAKDPKDLHHLEEAIQGYEAVAAEVAASEFMVTQLNLLIKIDNERNWNTVGRLIVLVDMVGERQKVKMVERATQMGFVEYLRP
ncbi:hypothetical protein ACE6H2_028226 [Prunus campanulata]